MASVCNIPASRPLRGVSLQSRAYFTRQLCSQSTETQSGPSHDPIGSIRNVYWRMLRHPRTNLKFTEIHNRHRLVPMLGCTKHLRNASAHCVYLRRCSWSWKRRYTTHTYPSHLPPANCGWIKCLSTIGSEATMQIVTFWNGLVAGVLEKFIKWADPVLCSCQIRIGNRVRPIVHFAEY